jgi:hypothetical protein
MDNKYSFNYSNCNNLDTSCKANMKKIFKDKILETVLANFLKL